MGMSEMFERARRAPKTGFGRSRYIDSYEEGYDDGYEDGANEMRARMMRKQRRGASNAGKPKRKLSDWQKYIKNKRNHIKFRDGKLNLKKMGVAFRRKRR
jgi:hypothetical protein